MQSHTAATGTSAPRSAAEEREGAVTDLEPCCSRQQCQEVKLVPVAACSSSFVLYSSPTLLHISSCVSPCREAGWIRGISSLGKQIRFSIKKKRAVQNNNDQKHVLVKYEVFNSCLELNPEGRHS